MTEKSIGQRIKETLTDKDISQKELAEKIGVDETGLSRIVHGKQDITGEQLAAVAKELFLWIWHRLGSFSIIRILWLAEHWMMGTQIGLKY